MAIAVFRAHFDRAVAAVEALEARASGIDANTTEAAVIDACGRVAVTAGEARAAQACALLTCTVARAVPGTADHAAVITNVAFDALAFEVGTILLRCIAGTMAAALIGALLSGAVMAAETLVALANAIKATAGVGTRIGASDDGAVLACEALLAHARAVGGTLAITRAVVGATLAVASHASVPSFTLALAIGQAPAVL